MQRRAVMTVPEYVQCSIRKWYSRMTVDLADVYQCSDQLLQEIRDEGQAIEALFVADELTQPEALVLTLQHTGRRPRILITKEDLVMMRAEKFSTREIAVLFGVSEPTVKRRCRELGISKQVRKYANMPCSAGACRRRFYCRPGSLSCQTMSWTGKLLKLYRTSRPWDTECYGTAWSLKDFVYPEKRFVRVFIELIRWV